MDMKVWRFAVTTVLLIACAGAASAEELAVKITRDTAQVAVQHEGQPVTIRRNQDRSNTIHPKFARTSRKCPPFCIQPMHMPNGVETIGEIEMLDYLKRATDGDPNILLVDSRGPGWVTHGTIPGSINVNFKRLNLRSADEADIAQILEQQFGAKRTEKFWRFDRAKTLVLFCNGAWCGQSPTNIRGLMRIGYPPSKLKWYRGGMQSWESVGLTTAKPE